MNRSCLLVLCFLAFFLGESIATITKFDHQASPSSKSELLQTDSRSTTKTETSSQAATETATGTETGCDPDCMFNYPYNEGGCKTEEEDLISYEGEGPGEEIPPIPVITTEEGGSTEYYEEWTFEHNEELPLIPEEHPPVYGGNEELLISYEGEGPGEEIFLPPTEEPPVFGEEGTIVIDYEGELPSEEIPPPPPVVTIDEELPIYFTGETTYGETNEEIPLLPPIIEEESGSVIIFEGEHPPIEPTPPDYVPPVITDECTYTSSVTSGVTHAYGQPTTYLTYTLHDDKKSQDVVYTYVLTTMHSGTVQTGDNKFVVYGTGAINFYNTYYGVSDYLTDKPGCSCVCGSSSYTFSYSFGF